MSKGGGACECPRVGAFFKLMTSRGQCPRGGCAWCSTHPSSDPPPHLAGWLRAWQYTLHDAPLLCPLTNADQGPFDLWPACHVTFCGRADRPWLDCKCWVLSKDDEWWPAMPPSPFHHPPPPPPPPPPFHPPPDSFISPPYQSVQMTSQIGRPSHVFLNLFGHIGPIAAMIISHWLPGRRCWAGETAMAFWERLVSRSLSKIALSILMYGPAQLG